MNSRRSLRCAACSVLAVIVFCLGPTAHAQEDFLSSKDAYLGQPRPSDTPRLFAPGLLADPGTVVLGRVAISSDGKEIYYCQGTWSDLTIATIKVLKFDGHKWNRPVAVVKGGYGDLALSMDGNVMFLDSQYPNQLRISKRTKDGWSAPEKLLQDTKHIYDVMPTASGVLYLGSDPDEEDKKFGITFSFSTMTISDGHATIKSLGRPLNEPGFNGDFYVAPDESYMIVSAKETKTNESQLYISFRKPDFTWTVPVSFGPKINTGLAHRWGQYVSPDGKYLFYAWGTKSEDTVIYWVRFDHLLESLRPKQQ